MIAVGIDISKSKSTVAILNADGSILVKPYTMEHTQSDMCALADYLRTFDEPLTILMEYTGHYHYPVLKKLQQEGFPVCVINPYQMKKYGDVEIHKAKTDKKDAIRIATYALEKAYKLVPYTSLEQKYEDLKFLSRQYNQRISSVAYTKVQLINNNGALSTKCICAGTGFVNNRFCQALLSAFRDGYNRFDIGGVTR